MAKLTDTQRHFLQSLKGRKLILMKATEPYWIMTSAPGEKPPKMSTVAAMLKSGFIEITEWRSPGVPKVAEMTSQGLDALNTRPKF